MLKYYTYRLEKKATNAFSHSDFGRSRKKSRIISSGVEDDEEALPNCEPLELTNFEDNINNLDIGFLYFKDAGHQRRYQEFRRNNFSFFNFCVVMIILTLMSINIIITTITSQKMSILFISASSIFFFLVIIPGWFILYVRSWDHISSEEMSVMIKVLSLYSINIENIMIINNSIFWCILLWAELTKSANQTFNLLNNSSSSNSVQVLPPDIVIPLIISTSFLQRTIKGNHKLSVFTAWLISTIAIIFFSVLCFNCYCVLPAICSILFGFILYDYEKNFLEMYTLSVKKESLLLTTVKSDHEKKLASAQSRALRDIIANVAHDLKTPLQAFTLGLESLQSMLIDFQAQIPPELEDLTMLVAVGNETLANLGTTTSFMTMTINRSIDFTKASKGMVLLPQTESVDLASSVLWPVECVRGIQSRIPIDIESLPPNICSHIFTDKQWLQDNLLCLISNAVKYSELGRVNVRVELEYYQPPPSSLSVSSTSRKDSRILRFEVVDNGVGISDEKKKIIFDTIEQTERRVGGTGLGLYSLSKRMEALKGNCGVSERRDGQQGCSFWFWFPYIPDTAGAQAAQTTQSQSTKKMVLGDTVLLFADEKETEEQELPYHVHSAGTLIHTIKYPSSSLHHDISSRRESIRIKLRNMHVLVVDDSLPILKMTKSALERDGHRVDQAENGAIALNMLKATRYDIVLMDLQMPVMDGFEAVQRFRRYEDDCGWVTERRQIIIGVSANSDDRTQEQALISGMDFFMPKPFTLRRFSDIVESMDLIVVS